jgi:3-oxoacyl-[acyl-carrier protein] reductase
MNVDLKGKVALVTGGARDIGRSISIKLAEAGASVAINYNASGERANALVREITSRGGRPSPSRPT